MVGEMVTRFLEDRVNTTFMVSWESSEAWRRESSDPDLDPVVSRMRPVIVEEDKSSRTSCAPLTTLKLVSDQ
jgi:uncharacterized linocin/CFP29 family protein